MIDPDSLGDVPSHDIDNTGRELDDMGKFLS
jgi:hypothetical protein